MKTQKRMIKSNRCPKLITRNNLVTKQNFIRTILSLLPQNKSWKQTFNVMRLTKSPPNKSSFLKWQVNASLEKSLNELKLIACRTTTTLPEFITSMMPERWPKLSFTKQRNSMRIAALHWQRKRNVLIVCSKKSVLTMIWQSAKIDQPLKQSI